MTDSLSFHKGDDGLLTSPPFSPTIAPLGGLRHGEAGAADSSQSGVKMMLRRINLAMAQR